MFEGIGKDIELDAFGRLFESCLTASCVCTAGSSGFVVWPKNLFPNSRGLVVNCGVEAPPCIF